MFSLLHSIKGRVEAGNLIERITLQFQRQYEGLIKSNTGILPNRLHWYWYQYGIDVLFRKCMERGNRFSLAAYARAGLMFL